MRAAVLVLLLWPATALAGPGHIGIGIDIDIHVDVPPPPPTPPPPPPEPIPPQLPPLPETNHGWDYRVTFALSMTTSAVASLSTFERGQGAGGAVMFPAVFFPLDMSIEAVHERFTDRSQTYIGYTLHIVDRRGTRWQPFAVIPVGVAIQSTPDQTTAQGFYGIGGGVRLRVDQHWTPSLELRLVHHQADEMRALQAENVADARASLMYVF